MSHVASRVVHRRLIMYETFFNDGLSLPDLHGRPSPPPPPCWNTWHSTHVTHPPLPQYLIGNCSASQISLGCQPPWRWSVARPPCRPSDPRTRWLLWPPDWADENARRPRGTAGRCLRPKVLNDSDTPLLLRVLFVVALQKKNLPSLVDWHQAASPQRRPCHAAHVAVMNDIPQRRLGVFAR